MLVGMGLIKNEHGVWCARQKVPPRLQDAVARVLHKRGKARQSFLKQSLRTKDKAEAKRRLGAVLIQFTDVIRRAESLIAPAPVLALRTTLSVDEITRLGQAAFARLLADDERLRSGGRPYMAALYEQVRKQSEQDGDEPLPPALPLDSLPEFGMSREQLQGQRDNLVGELQVMQDALALGDISAVQDDLTILLDEYRINLDRESTAYRELGTAVLNQYVRALKAIAQRNAGEPVETPRIERPAANTKGAAVGAPLRAAFEGWQKEKPRSSGALTEYGRAIAQFIELHGDLPVAAIRRPHATAFRKALQDVPRVRSDALSKMTFPELAQWGCEHPDQKKISTRTVNKQFGGVQAVVNWARKTGEMIPDDLWTDPFSDMRLDEEDPEGGPFEHDQLRTLFGSRVFTGGGRPEAGRGDVAFWLPLLGLFTGARRGELAVLTASDIQHDEVAGEWSIALRKDITKGKRLKTASSARTVPMHPELVRIGFSTT